MSQNWLYHKIDDVFSFEDLFKNSDFIKAQYSSTGIILLICFMSTKYYAQKQSYLVWSQKVWPRKICPSEMSPHKVSRQNVPPTNYALPELYQNVLVC